MYHPIRANFQTDIRSVPPSYTMRHYHEHNRWELFYLIDGSCTMYLDKQMYFVESGAVVLIPEGASHMTTYLPGQKHRRSLLYFNTEELAWLKEQAGEHVVERLKDHFVVQVPPKRMEYLADLITKISFERRGVDHLSMSFNRAYFYEMILFLLRCQVYQNNVVQRMDVSNEVIQKVIEYIIANFHEDISLSETAKIFNMSESNLSKKFKAFTGYRFREYLIDVRTHAAADALLNTDLSVTEIASQCGFSDSNTFGDTFKRIYGVSPSYYRKRC